VRVVVAAVIAIDARAALPVAFAQLAGGRQCTRRARSERERLNGRWAVLRADEGEANAARGTGIAG
jgi:hypothetical protein